MTKWNKMRKRAREIVDSAETIEGPLDYRTKAHLIMDIISALTDARNEGLLEAAALFNSPYGECGYYLQHWEDIRSKIVKVSGDV